MSEQVVNAEAAQPNTETAQVEPNAVAPAATTEVTESPKVATKAETAEAPKAEADKTKEESPVVTAKYDLKLPEGALVDAAHAEKVSSFAKDAGFSQEQAQALLDRDVAMAKEQHAKHEAVIADWKQQVMNDPELGGDKLAAKHEAAQRALKLFGSDETLDFLDGGLGNHPAALRFLSRIGEAAKDDKAFIPTQSGKGTPKSAAEEFYGYMNEQK